MELLVLAYGEEFAAPWPIFNFDTFDDRLAAGRPDLRRLVLHVADFRTAAYHVLWWGERAVPEGLDDRIRDGTLLVEDLQDACFAEFRGVTCLNCEAQLHTLVADVAHPLVARQVTARPPADAWRRKCLVCKESIQLPILEFLD